MERGGMSRIDTAKSSTGTYLFENIDPQIYAKLVACGFEGIIKIGSLPVNHKLITALVERGRPETYSFHLSVGEATITLQDVEVLTGLRVDGRAVTGRLKSTSHLETSCERFLGKVPPSTRVKGNLISLVWLTNEFSNLPINANNDIVDQYTRAFIIRLFGGLLFNNCGNNGVYVMLLSLLEHVNANGIGGYAWGYAWGAAVLAYIYRELSKATNPKKSQMCGYL